MINAGSVKARWASWVRRFWWLRGAAAAFALISLLTLSLGISDWEAVRLLRAVIRTWREIAGAIGSLIGRVPGLPELNGEVVTLLVIYLSVGAPGMFVTFWRLPEDVERRNRENRVRRGERFSVAGIALLPLVSLVGFVTAAEQGEEVLAVIFLALLALNILVGFFSACIQIPGFGRGAVAIPLFLATLEILAVLRDPLIGRAVNEWACSVLEIEPGACAA